MFQKFLREPKFLTLYNEFYINRAFKQMERKVNISSDSGTLISFHIYTFL